MLRPPRVCATLDGNPNQVASATARIDTYLRRVGRLSSAVTAAGFTKRNLAILNVRYHVLSVPGDASTRPTDDAIAANHRQLNADFTARNFDITHMPKTGPYADFTSSVGRADVAFAPISLNARVEDIDIKHVSISRGVEFSGIVSIIQSNVSPPVDGMLNVYIAPLTSNQLLGQAFVEGNSLVVAPGTVGSVNGIAGSGPWNDYIGGRTLTHEMGHALGLSHPFAFACGASPHADVPTTRNPNYTARISYSRSTDEWIASNCNHQQDVVNASTPGYVWRSCTRPNTPGSRYEGFMDFMDYASDGTKRMFTRQEATQMYVYATLARRRGGLFDVTLAPPLEGNDELPIGTLTSEPTDGPTSAPTSAPTSGPTSGPTSAPTSAPTSGPTSEPTDGPTSAPTSDPISGTTSEPTNSLLDPDVVIILGTFVAVVVAMFLVVYLISAYKK